MWTWTWPVSTAVAPCTMAPIQPSMKPRIQTMKATDRAIPPRVSPLRHRFLARFLNPIFAEIIVLVLLRWCRGVREYRSE